MNEQAYRASTEDWCERFPDEGHSWSYTSHAGTPRIETRSCTTCGYLSVQPTRESIARWLRERAERDGMWTQDGDSALSEAADVIDPPSTTGA